jgi:MFS transporter, DHA3 family, macrolide efflux protein
MWIGQAFSIFGSQLVQFALIWWLTVSTGSATVLAMASITGLVPQIFLGPVAGAFVDRGNRKAIMIAADALVAGATAMLALLFVFGAVQAWEIYLVLFIRAIGGSFHWPAMSASTSLMVPKQHLTRVQGANQTLNGGLNIFSAPLAALLLAGFSIQVVLAIDVFTAFLAILPLIFIRVPQPPVREITGEVETSKPTLREDISAGFRYVREWRGLMMLLIMATLINLVLSPAFSLLPLLVRNEFGGEALQLAWVESASGIGIILGGVILSVWGGFRRRILTSLLGLVGIAVGTILIGTAPSSLFSLVIGGMFIVGMMMPFTNGPIMAVVQAIVAPEMQGRVFTLVGSLAAAMSPLGLVVAGPLSDAIGVRTWFILGGVVTGLMGLGSLFVPSVLHIEDQAEPGTKTGLQRDEILLAIEN